MQFLSRRRASWRACSSATTSARAEAEVDNDLDGAVGPQAAQESLTQLAQQPQNKKSRRNRSGAARNQSVGQASESVGDVSTDNGTINMSVDDLIRLLNSKKEDVSFKAIEGVNKNTGQSFSKIQVLENGKPSFAIRKFATATDNEEIRLRHQPDRNTTKSRNDIILEDDTSHQPNGVLRNISDLTAFKNSKGIANNDLRKLSTLHGRFRKSRINPLPRFLDAGGPLSTAAIYGGQIKSELNKAVLDPIYLRDMCTCELCVDPSSGQKNFWTVDIPNDIRVAQRADLPDGGHAFTWTNDVPGFPSDHITKIREEELYYHLFAKNERRSRTLESWSREKIERELMTVDYEAYLNDLETYRSTIRALRDNGLVFIKNVPESEQSVVNIAEKIGPLRNSFYGMTWDVKSVPKAVNVAYTAQHLGFHMDLLYMANPPKLQFLHCLRSSAAGGASLFSDSYQAIEEMVQDGVPNVDQLEYTSTVFHYNKDGKQYMQNRPFLEMPVHFRNARKTGRITPFIDNVNWSPPFQGPHIAREVLGQPEQLLRWHQLTNEFKKRTESEKNVFEKKMAPGECVIFDNRRILHARTAFDPGDVGKERWLKGCYVDGDPWESELNVHDI